MGLLHVLSPAQLVFKKQASDLVGAPQAVEIDQHARYPVKVIQAVAAFGVLANWGAERSRWRRSRCDGHWFTPHKQKSPSRGALRGFLKGYRYCAARLVAAGL